MNSQDIQQNINRVEECADEAKRACQSASSVPQELRQAIESLHQQAREAKQRAGGPQDEGTLRQTVMQLEGAADRAKQACRSAGNVEPQLQQAVQRAHDELSRLKKQIQADSPA
jgi:hypothetical protein